MTTLFNGLTQNLLKNTSCRGRFDGEGLLEDLGKRAAVVTGQTGGGEGGGGGRFPTDGKKKRCAAPPPGVVWTRPTRKA